MAAQLKLFSRISFLRAAATMVPLEFLTHDEISGGDNAWIIKATALVLFMAMPGLALFYADLVRSKCVVGFNAVFWHRKSDACHLDGDRLFGRFWQWQHLVGRPWKALFCGYNLRQA